MQAAPPIRFSQQEREAIYSVIEQRRDVRIGYLPQPLDDACLLRLLHAAQCSPSVGLMQPARYLVIRSESTRRAVHSAFERANAEASAIYTGDQQGRYTSLKLQGLLDAPQHLCVLCDHRTTQGHGLGRQTMPQMAAYSVVCAVQNLWLAARAEGVGVGWVSIFHPEELRSLLGIPEGVELVAYLCIGYVEEFATTPDLERFGWEQRRDLDSALFLDSLDQPFVLNAAIEHEKS